MDSLLDFDVTHAKSLEDCLNSQTIGRIPYDLANNKALLKYYQVNPSVADLDNVANILLLALMELPNTFYLASSYLVPSKFWSNPKISSIKIIADKLERAQYAEFWEIVTRESETFSTVREFSTKIRQYIASCLRETYKSVSLSTFKSFTNITSDSELAAIPFIEVNGDTVVFQSTGAQKGSRSDHYRLDEVLKLYSVVDNAAAATKRS